MTVDEWLDNQIKQGHVHPDYRRIYYWVLDNYKKYQELYSAEDKPIEPEFPCLECGAKKRLHRKGCSHYNPIK